MKRRDFVKQTVQLSALGATAPLENLYQQVNWQAQQSVHNSEKNFDVIVLGVGSMGSATCYYLAKQGVKVLGLEQFDIPHEHGSHAGQSRIIRKAYFEHSDYVPLLESAYKNWKHLEETSGSKVYYKTGLLYFGQPGHLLIKGVRESSTKYKVEIKELKESGKSSVYSQFNTPADFASLIEPDAGFLTPERAILLYSELALKLGATIHTREKTIEWKRSGNLITVKTDKTTYQCKKLVITAGAWAAKMIPSLSKNLKVTRQVVAWVKPKRWDAFELGNFPCWTIADPQKPGIYYGFPILPSAVFGAPIGLKLAHHAPGIVSDPDRVNRSTSQLDEANIMYALNKYIPDGFDAIISMKTCLYTYTPDENFILDYLPGYDKDVVVAAGFSGHGFKFASVVGEIMCDLATSGSTKEPIDFLGIDRFS